MHVCTCTTRKKHPNDSYDLVIINAREKEKYHVNSYKFLPNSM